MFLILIASRIINLKMIKDVLVLGKYYQCGDSDSLGPVVKHSVVVRDSTISLGTE